MNKFRKFAFAFILCELGLAVFFNLYIAEFADKSFERSYMVDVSRIISRMENGEPISGIDLDEYDTVISVRPFDAAEHGKYAYTVEEAEGELYRFEYRQDGDRRITGVANIILALVMLATLILLLYLDRKLITPFSKMADLPGKLAKGNLAVPIKEEKSRYFGKFLWGMDMLREKLEDDKRRELELLKEKKTLLLSLSHDVKTPLSAIDLYTRALKTGLYDSDEKQQEALEGIEGNIAKIKKYIGEIADASREDFLSFEVENREIYLADILKAVDEYYREKTAWLHTEFFIEKVQNCLIYGDGDRIVEVLQNCLENAVKYGDGRRISITFGEEENCKLITVSNTGSGLGEDELPHLFDAFYRGSNSGNVSGSGLGLYICKELMHKMDGDIFAGIVEDHFRITLVLRRM